MSACNFIKTRLQHRFFPVKFEKFLRIPILKNIYERLLSAITFAFQKSSKMYLFSEFLKITQKNVIGCLIIPNLLESTLMMNCFCGMVDQQKKLCLISSRDHCQWFLTLENLRFITSRI